ncbi:phospholipase D-like domain-containing protein [Jeongeupia chitinilytica]|uniref:Phospholipase n=1 Tax=Jeongeupia chitinilytica TaxID=1041641 RepID=A0ABQ3GYC3_9NEIS|nr:phospholipase D-like domain-containing protein [Jeongeupia chitinilytica]GHD59588.1 phospholipase [Jeongeupia chitinilytica]
MSKAVKTPVSQDRPLAATCTLPWFLQAGEYYPHEAGIQVLVNGETAFKSVHEAIARAKRNVSIICWGFQPSMYFVRNGSDTVSYPGLPGPVPTQIGRLLERKAAQGVKVRVLCFAYEAVNPLQYVPATAAFSAPANITGMEATVGESNTPGRWDIRKDDRPGFATDAQYQYDVDWYHRYDDDQSASDETKKAIRANLLGQKSSQNLHFYSRGFSAGERKDIYKMQHDDKGIKRSTKAALAGGTSHHQKTVLVDYDDPEQSLAFIMGHNMLDEYWDTDDHHHARHTDPRRGRNGIVGPREDFSTRLTGPVVGDVFFNFSAAWKNETGEVLSPAKFKDYKPRFVRGGNCMSDCVPAKVQALRTQPQAKPPAQDIKKAYYQAVNNVTSYIYIENQYFRWPPLAETIKKAAKQQKDNGRKTPIYLFVVTNSTDAGVGKGTVNTHRMMESLGRSDTVPGVTRANEYDDAKAQLGQARQRVVMAQGAMNNYTQLRIPNAKSKAAADLDKAKADYEQAKAAEQKAKERLDAVQKGQDEPIAQVDQPGLKTHICTLVAPDSPAGNWLETYIHAKLMIVNDAFTTIGSANINTRSMEVDSEMNVLLDRPEVATPLRKKLWGMHSNRRSGGDNFKDEFKVWAELIKENAEAGKPKSGQSPVAALRGFVRTSIERSNSD